MLGLDLAQMD